VTASLWIAPGSRPDHSISRFSFKVRMKRSATPSPSGSRTNEGEASIPRLDFVLEIAGHVVGAMSVTQLQATRHSGRDGSEAAMRRLAHRLQSLEAIGPTAVQFTSAGCLNYPCRTPLRSLLPYPNSCTSPHQQEGDTTRRSVWKQRRLRTRRAESLACGRHAGTPSQPVQAAAVRKGQWGSVPRDCLAAVCHEFSA
jgi:hypothetical protein